MQMEDKICSPEKYIHVTWMKKRKKKKVYDKIFLIIQIYFGWIKIYFDII